MKRFLFGVVMLVATASIVRAEQPTCTGDRHYDGVACCPVIDPPPANDPNGPACPTVTCECKDGDTTTVQQRVINVTVNKCPDYTNVMYRRCTQRRVGAKVHKNDVVFQGRAYHCSLPTNPKRFYIPVS